MLNDKCYSLSLEIIVYKMKRCLLKWRGFNVGSIPFVVEHVLLATYNDELQCSLYSVIDIAVECLLN